MEYTTVGLEYNAGKIAYIKCIANDTFKSVNIKDRSFLLILVKSGSVTFSVLKRRLKFSRKNFYFTSFLASEVIAVIYFAFNVALNNILGYIIYPLQVGILCSFAFWIVELILDLFKLLKTNIK